MEPTEPNLDEIREALGDILTLAEQDASDRRSDGVILGQVLSAVEALRDRLPAPEPCPYTHSHTRGWCGYKTCRSN